MTFIDTLVTWWEHWKNSLVDSDQNVRALIHIHGGLAVFVFIAFFCRRGMASRWPLILVYIAEFSNEIADVLSIPKWDQVWFFIDTGTDLLNTLLWPTVLFLLARVMEWRGRRSGQVADETADDLAVASGSV